METQLVRTEILTQESDDARIGLAKKAESLLGYSVLRRHLRVAGDLSAALQLLEIHPFDKQTVLKYMEEMRAAKQAELDAETREFMERHRGQQMWGVERGFASWNYVALNEYPEPVPEFVLSKAIQIKELCPAVTFTVSALQVNYRTADPFLLATLGDESFFVEVWDEPKFEKEL